MPKQLFIKGQSGNPKGKPRGVRHTATQISYALMEGNLEEVLRTVIERAKSGDMTACRMIVDKVLPNTKDRPIDLDLPAISDLNGVGKAQADILQAVSIGGITPSEGEKISSIIEARRRVIETIDLRRAHKSLGGGEMSLNKRLSKIEEKTPMVDKVTFIGWADCEWRKCEGLTRGENESIDEFEKRVMKVTDKKFIWCE